MKDIDITTARRATIAIEHWLNLSESEILKYALLRGENYSSDDFLKFWGIPEETLILDDISLISLHVTSNTDRCSAIKRYGLCNLQESLRLETPLNQYLKDHGVRIELESGKIYYKDKDYDVSKWKAGFSLSDDEENMNSVHRKLYKDHQINGFFCYGNVLEYGGGVKRRPEFLYTLSELLKDHQIEHDWGRNSKCYILKFRAKPGMHVEYTFDIKKGDCEEPHELGLIQRKWVLHKALGVIHNDVFGYSPPEVFSYLNFNETISPDAIIETYTEAEYIKEYELHNW